MLTCVTILILEKKREAGEGKKKLAQSFIILIHLRGHMSVAMSSMSLDKAMARTCHLEVCSSL
jgi:hypothetical protein